MKILNNNKIYYFLLVIFELKNNLLKPYYDGPKVTKLKESLYLILTELQYDCRSLVSAI